MSANPQVVRRRRSSLRERLIGSSFAAFWLLWWSLFTLLFDSSLVFHTLKTWQAQSYASVPGEVIHSDVRRDAGNDGSSFRADVRFRYTVNGVKFTGNRLHVFGFHENNPVFINGVVKSYPVGKKVNVFYNSDDPSDSALSRTLDGLPLFMLLFLTPFNLIMVGGWCWVAKRVAGVRTLPVRRYAEKWFVRQTKGQPLVVTMIVAGVASVGAIIFVGFGGWADGLGSMIATWAGLLGLSGLAYWHTLSLILRESPVLILDDGMQTVTWPCSETTPAFSLPRSRLLGIEIDDSPQPDDDENAWDFSILLSFNGEQGQPAKRLVLKTTSGTEAAALADWLEEWAGLPVEKVSNLPEQR